LRPARSPATAPHELVADRQRCGKPRARDHRRAHRTDHKDRSATDRQSLAVVGSHSPLHEIAAERQQRRDEQEPEARGACIARVVDAEDPIADRIHNARSDELSKWPAVDHEAPESMPAGEQHE
jgi:hypothetical protein